MLVRCARLNTQKAVQPAQCSGTEKRAAQKPMAVVPLVNVHAIGEPIPLERHFFATMSVSLRWFLRMLRRGAIFCDVDGVLPSNASCGATNLANICTLWNVRILFYGLRDAALFEFHFDVGSQEPSAWNSEGRHLADLGLENGMPKGTSTFRRMGACIAHHESHGKDRIAQRSFSPHGISDW